MDRDGAAVSLGFLTEGPVSMISPMNALGHGVDMIACGRLQEAIDRHGQRFIERVFTPAEIEYCHPKRRRIEHFAGRFAAKEAVLKLLGTGWRSGINWTDIEIRNLPSGQPTVTLKGRCREIADQLGVRDIVVSISHIETHAIASAIGSVESPPAEPNVDVRAP